MIKSTIFLTLIITLTSVSRAAEPAPAPRSLESIEWCDLWISHGNETNLPRVLLIGDSITRAYYPKVEEHLAGKAYVGRLASSAFVSDPMLLQEVAMVLDEYHFDVIHFNNGMHGWQHDEAEYARFLPKLLATIRKHAPHAKLIWGNTTPLKVSPPPADNPTAATDGRIVARNAIAAKLMQAEGIPVDDLYTPMQSHPEYHSDNVHFGDQGIAIQATQVAAQIEPLLNR